ncbi:ATP-dependent helicase [Candidatus Woesearchaeota archaeon]|nr:MAG: ATP-dependent helicase [Candidatus Woesearchaeota archaeon]
MVIFLKKTRVLEREKIESRAKESKNLFVKKKPDNEGALLNILHPFVKEWFFSRFKSFSLPQLFGVMEIHSRNNVLISAPTGATKTLTAFLSILNELVDAADKGILRDKIYALYISPLKALNYDIEVNLKEPLEEISKIAKRHGKKLNIRVGVRTGDTSPSRRQSMARRPPHILITTPESLAILLSTKSFQSHLAGVEWAIIDEIHALAENKRGVHLSLSLERLQYLCENGPAVYESEEGKTEPDKREEKAAKAGSKTAYKAASESGSDSSSAGRREPVFSGHLCRVGLSATVAPLDEIARYLAGFDARGEPRPCTLVDVQFLKDLDLKVLSPVSDLIETDYAIMHESLYKMLHDLIQSHKTTLVFTNTRSATERVVHNLRDKFPKFYGENIGAHHSSLSAEHRLSIESRLRRGELKAVVCSTSLELGIDIGFIDLVVLLGSPKSVARALQRVGRSGHQLHAVTKGRIVVLDRDDLVECSVLLKCAVEKKIDRIHIPTNCVDVLAQHIYGAAIDRKWYIDELFNVVRRSYCFRHLSMGVFEDVLNYLAGYYVSLEDRNVYAKIWYDRDSRMIGRRGKLARMIYMTNIGTIPDEASVKVKLGNRVIGEIEEAFLERLKRGDVFVLGGSTYQFLYSRGMTAFVSGSVDRPPNVPSWFSEMLPLSFDLALEIGRFRRLMSEKLSAGVSKQEIISFLHDYLYLDTNAAESLYRYFYEQHKFSVIPHDKLVLVEHYNDSVGSYPKKYIVFHTLFGRRVNDALSRAVAFAVSRSQHADVEIGITDNGFYISPSKDVKVLDALKLLKPDELRSVLELAIDKTEVLNRRFRHCATRSLMILRSYKGKTKRVGRQQLASTLLQNAVRSISEDFPILKEAKREVIEDVMDVHSAEVVLRGISSGRIKVQEVHSDLPSPFSFNIVLQGHSDVLRMEDRMSFLRNMHNMIKAKIALKEAKGKNKK